MSKINIALFDFCGTVVSKQTGDDFICKLLKHEKKFLRWLIAEILRKTITQRIIAKITLDQNRSKYLILRLAAGAEKQSIDAFSVVYAEDLKRSYIIPQINEALNKHIREKDYVCIVSAGYECYISSFFSGRVTVLANKLKYKNDIFTGKIIGDDCYGEKKVEIVDKHIGNIKYRSNLTCYSDSPSDIPLLNYSNQRVVVSRNKSQLWAETINATQVIY